MKLRRLSITARILVPVVGLVIAGVAVLLIVVTLSTRQQVVDSSVQHAMATIDQFRALRGYYTDRVVRKVKSGTNLKVSFDHAQKEDTIPLPATMVQDLSTLLAESHNTTQIKLYSAWPFPVRKDRVLDSFMTDATAHLTANPDATFVRTESVEGATRVRVAIADKMVNESCVNCHNSHPDTPKKGWKIGDVRGVLEVATPIDREIAANNALVIRIATGAIGGTVIIILLVGWILRRSVTRPVVRSVEFLKDCGSQVSAAAGQVSSASNTLAEGASEQAASLEETSASLEEISSMTRRNVENAQAAETIARAARQAATDGTADMGEMNAAMQAIKESGNNIGKIIKTIDEIAFQTNILALNAAVEAARAGDAGLGFAVVADEVRNLAQRSAVAARETAEKIEDSIRRSGVGVEICARITSRLSDIADKSTQLDTLVAEVARASREQSLGISQLGTAVVEMDKVTQSNAATAEESASAATELHHQADALQNAVRELLENVVGDGAGTTVASARPATSTNSTVSVSPVSAKQGGGRLVKAPAPLKRAKTNPPARKNQKVHDKFLDN
jgi:hypothetical protein